MKMGNAYAKEINTGISFVQMEFGSPDKAGYLKNQTIHLTGIGKSGNKWDYTVNETSRTIPVIGDMRKTERIFESYENKGNGKKRKPLASVRITEQKHNPLDLKTIEILDRRGKRNGLCQSYSGERLRDEAFYVHGLRLPFFVGFAAKLCTSSKVMKQFNEVKQTINDYQKTKFYQENPGTNAQYEPV